jgi:signal transduction histidine kinase
MSRLTTFLKRHTLWVGFAAVLLPLVVLLALQYVWLARLERVSAIAHRAALNNYLEAVGSEIQYFYRAAATSALNIPASLFTQGRLEKAASYWAKRPIEGARRLFLVDYTRTYYGNFLVYDPKKETLEQPLGSDETWAIIVACMPWQMLNIREAGAGAQPLRVDETYPAHRLILNPITDDASHVVGIAGMILDEEFFRARLLPEAIDKALPGFFPDVPREDLAVTVRDDRDRVILGSVEPDTSGESVSRTLPFVFKDWTVALHSPRSSPEQWARANFAFNITLSALLALALMGGIALALRAADRAVRLSEMKSDFVSNVSHELRTPLASIRVFAELLRLGRVETPVKVREYGDYIETESRRLSRLIENILDFARIESGRKTYRFETTDLREVVAATLKSFEVHLKHGGFRIACEVPAGPLPPIAVDADAIGQALHNLLDNAIKYSGECREITVRLRREGEELVIAVEDRGIGIPKDEQRRIFDRFHRVGTGLVHEVKGSGLGLAIVDHIVRVHGGRIAVESEPGRGSTFSIRLPLRPGAAMAGGQQTGAAETAIQAAVSAAARPAGAGGLAGEARPGAAGAAAPVPDAGSKT